MSVSEQDVRHIASLARLGLPDERIPALAQELNGILVHMEVLQQVSIDPAAASASDASGMPLRADTPGSVHLAREREAFAPAMRDGFFLVPRLSTHDDEGGATGPGPAPGA